MVILIILYRTTTLRGQVCVGNGIRARYQGGGNTPGFRVAMRMDGGKWGRGRVSGIFQSIKPSEAFVWQKRKQWRRQFRWSTDLLISIHQSPDSQCFLKSPTVLFCCLGGRWYFIFKKIIEESICQCWRLKKKGTSCLGVWTGKPF